MQVAVKTEVQGDKTLMDTISLANIACQECIDTGLKNKTWNKTKLHNLTYREIRRKYPMLNSSLVTAVRDQASNMLKALKLKRKPLKKAYSGIRLNHNTFKVFTDSNIVSLSTIEGRRKYSIKIPRYFIDKYTIEKVTAGALFGRKGRLFKCHICGFSLHSDLNASRNIAFLAKDKISRLPVNQPIVACDDLKASLRDELRASIVASSAF